LVKEIPCICRNKSEYNLVAFSVRCIVPGIVTVCRTGKIIYCSGNNGVECMCSGQVIIGTKISRYISKVPTIPTYIVISFSL
jgi:hypothetical protein